MQVNRRFGILFGWFRGQIRAYLAEWLLWKCRSWVSMPASMYRHVPRNHPLNTALLEMRRRANTGLVWTLNIRWHAHAGWTASLEDRSTNILNFFRVTPFARFYSGTCAYEMFLTGFRNCRGSCATGNCSISGVERNTKTVASYTQVKRTV